MRSMVLVLAGVVAGAACSDGKKPGVGTTGALDAQTELDAAEAADAVDVAAPSDAGQVADSSDAADDIVDSGYAVDSEADTGGPDGGDGGEYDAAADRAGFSAADGPSTNCGGPSLASVCSAYCGAMEKSCTGANVQFSTGDACVEACTLPTWSCGMPPPDGSSGNTVFCRLAHAMAAMQAPEQECPLAGPNSAACK